MTEHDKVKLLVSRYRYWLLHNVDQIDNELETAIWSKIKLDQIRKDVNKYES